MYSKEEKARFLEYKLSWFSSKSQRGVIWVLPMISRTVVLYPNRKSKIRVWKNAFSSVTRLRPTEILQSGHKPLATIQCLQI
jgi:hypothetical protein